MRIRETPTHQLIRTTLEAHRFRTWIIEEKKETVYSGTEQECDRALQALRDVNRTHQYSVEPIDGETAP